MSTAAGDPDLSTLWEPVSLGPIAVRNRIMMGPATLLYAVDNVLSDRHVAFYAERARGGAGLLVSEEHGAFRLGIGAFATACTAWHERAVPRFAALADAVHSHGGHQLIQLYAPGANDGSALVMDQWRAPWAPSRVPDPDGASMPVAMDSEQIAEVVDGFAASARNVEIGGLDGVEVHAAHSWLVGQFLSPHFNRRTDEYGGSVAGRCRLAIEIGEAIRARTRRLVVGIQPSLDEYIGAAGITAQDTEDQVELLAASGLFDYVNLSTGGSFSTYRTIPTMEVAEGFLAEPGARIKEIVGDRMKVVLVGRIRSLEMAARLVERGCADIVAMTRAQLADPGLVRKGMLVIVDESGEYLPLGLADLLSQAGAAVDIVSRHPVVGATVHDSLDAPHVLGRLAARAVRLIPGHLLERIEGDRVEIREVWSGRECAIDGVDAVILSLLRTPDDALFHELGDHHPDVRRVGDALAPRRTHEVIHEAEAMARAL